MGLIQKPTVLFATRIPGHVQPVGRPCGTWMHYAMRDVKDMGQQMGGMGFIPERLLMMMMMMMMMNTYVWAYDISC